MKMTGRLSTLEVGTSEKFFRTSSSWFKHRTRSVQVSENGEVVVLRDLFAKLVNWIDRFKDIGDPHFII